MTRDDTRRDESSDDGAALERALAERGEAYARVTVVRREPPVSANVGDRAVVTRSGEIHGWIGGMSCAQSIVSEQATAAIEDGEPRLLGIAPDPDTVDRPGVSAFPMQCHSEGVLELFVEPVTPAPELLVVGGSPIARSLARLAAELPVDVTVVDPDGNADGLPAGTAVTATTDPEDIAAEVGTAPLVVVASMGGYDARGVAAGVHADAGYIGLVASDTRCAEVIERAAGLLDRDPDAVEAAVTNPAGVDITAHTPPEIAASILAEVVDVRARAVGADAEGETDTAPDTDADATDPVCGMTVTPDEAAASVHHDDETYHFCCRGCADSFRADPTAYLEEDSTAPA
ncbi:XdhC family protein [Haloplanus ruber]|uniref:XdhC family protein n=1 Tax=Haloplanus ruber TaxID=869892 RepID=A0ABD6D0B5_9EURY|nr:XdhC family protein [Haloplanus ruber]